MQPGLPWIATLTQVSYLFEAGLYSSLGVLGLFLHPEHPPQTPKPDPPAPNWTLDSDRGPLPRTSTSFIEPTNVDKSRSMHAFSPECAQSMALVVVLSVSYGGSTTVQSASRLPAMGQKRVGSQPKYHAPSFVPRRWVPALAGILELGLTKQCTLGVIGGSAPMCGFAQVRHKPYLLGAPSIPLSTQNDRDQNRGHPMTACRREACIKCEISDMSFF